MPGPLPKPPATRQRRHRMTTAATFEAPPATKVELTDAVPGRAWHPRTIATWATWWASPMVAEWVDADIPGIIEVALLVDEFWTAEAVADRVRLRAEIRMSSREFGLTPIARRQLQWEIKRVQGRAQPATAEPRRRQPTRTVLSVLRSA